MNLPDGSQLVTISAVLSPAALTMAVLVTRSNVRLRRRLRATHAELSASRLAALRDVLTGVANRAGIESHLTMCAASTEPVWLLMIDLDGFKPVNDVHTHAAGDIVLSEVARRLRRVVDSRRGLIGRLGGDEFIIVSDASTADDAGAQARRVVAELRKPITVADEVHVRISASVGLVQMRPGDDPAAALHSADVAMYQAKAAGGARAVVFDGGELLAAEGGRPSTRVRDIHPQRVADAGLDACDQIP